MPWFKIDDTFHGHPKVMELSPAAVGVWTLAGTWCANYLTDGEIKPGIVSRLGGTPEMIQELVQAGLWIETGDAYRFKDWDDYQPMKADVEAERDAARERMRMVRAKKKGVERSGEQPANVQANFKQCSEEVRVTPTQPDPARPLSSKEDTSEVADATHRLDVQKILDLLDERIQANGAKKPTRIKKNTEAARLLLDLDGYTVEQVEWIIRWATSNEFWRKNILSMSKLREKFDQLKLQAGVGAGNAVTGFNGEVNVEAVLGRDLWMPPAPPDDLPDGEYGAWVKAQREAHDAERLNEARRRSA